MSSAATKASKRITKTISWGFKGEEEAPQSPLNTGHDSPGRRSHQQQQQQEIKAGNGAPVSSGSSVTSGRDSPVISTNGSSNMSTNDNGSAKHKKRIISLTSSILKPSPPKPILQPSVGSEGSTDEKERPTEPAPILPQPIVSSGANAAKAAGDSDGEDVPDNRATLSSDLKGKEQEAPKEVCKPQEDPIGIDMATRSRAAGRSAGSPLTLGGTAKTEERRTRSKSRQRIDSQFLRKADDIPLVRSTVDYMWATYGVLKGSSPLMKQSLDRGEDLAYWLRGKATDALVATKLDQPLKQLDLAAADGLHRLEKTSTNINNQWRSTSQDMQSQVKSRLFSVQTASNQVYFTFFEVIQTVLDYLEERLDPVMLKASPEAAKYSTEPVFSMTAGRMMDMTYRFNLGLLGYLAGKAQEMTNPVEWGAFFKRYFTWEKIYLRASIVSQEVFAPAGKRTRYMDDKELTEVDRRIIDVSRTIVAAANSTAETFRKVPAQMAETLGASATYASDVAGQLFRARSLLDVTGIGLHEVRVGVERLQDYFGFLKGLPALDSLMDWMSAQEKVLSKAL